MVAGLFARHVEFEIVAMTGEDTADAAAIHARRFPRPWSDGEIHRLLAQPANFGFMARPVGPARQPAGGFVLARQAADEAEILSIGVAERFGRRGLGWRLMRAAMGEAAERGARAMFLEVDERNAGALALYRRLGFVTVGERKSYYSDLAGNRSRAYVMRRALGPGEGG